MTESQNPKFKRSLMNLRLVKDGKLRFVFVLMTGSMILTAALLISVMANIDRTLKQVQAVDPAQLNLVEQIRSAVSGALAVGLIFNVASAVIALLFGLMVSHRFCGPVVPLTRHLRDLAEGKFASRVELRPGDELLELQDAQNFLAESLEKKSKR